VRNRRVVPLLAAASVAVLAVAGCGSTTAAVRVDDESISRRDFEDQLQEVYDNDDFRGVLFGEVGQEQLRGEDDPVGSFTQEFVSAMAFVQVQFMVIPKVLDDLDLEITDEDRDAVAQQIEQSAPGVLDELPASMRDQYVDGFAGFDLLRNELDENEFDSVFTEAIQDADVRVSSRYGTWNADDLTIDPPTSPRPAPGSGGDSGDGEPADGSDLPAG
jgi:hypothetical protein